MCVFFTDDITKKNSPKVALDDKYKTYTKKWRVPADTKPGSYAFDFSQTVQLRRGDLATAETVKVNIVD